jgi:hypothetical protein
MKKVLFLMLFLIFLRTASVNAQVTIGEDAEPHPGAVLDLKTSKGLLLPKVALANVNIFQLSEEKAAEAVGMIVYNNSDATIGGQGKGIYVWDGGKWMFAVSSEATLVTSVTVSSENDATSVMSGSTLQFYADVAPDNATNRSVNWSVEPGGTDTGSIDPVSGLLTADSPGTVKVRATAADGSDQYGEKQIMVTPLYIPVTGITISPSSVNDISVPATVSFTATVTPPGATDGSVTWAILSQPQGANAILSADGQLSVTTIGTYVIEARSNGSPEFSSSATADFVMGLYANTCDGCKAFAEAYGRKNEFPYWHRHVHNNKGCSLDTNWYGTGSGANSYIEFTHNGSTFANPVAGNIYYAGVNFICGGTR